MRSDVCRVRTELGLALLESAWMITLIVPLLISTYAIIDYLDLKRRFDSIVSHEIAAIDGKSLKLISGYQDTWLYLHSQDLTSGVQQKTEALNDALLQLTGSAENFYVEVGFTAFQVGTLSGKVGELASLGEHTDDDSSGSKDGTYSVMYGNSSLVAAQSNLVARLLQAYPLDPNAWNWGPEHATNISIPSAIRGIPPVYVDDLNAKASADQFGNSNIYSTKFGTFTPTDGHHQNNFIRSTLVGGVLVVADFKDTYVGRIMSSLGMSTRMEKFNAFPPRILF